MLCRRLLSIYKVASLYGKTFCSNCILNGVNKQASREGKVMNKFLGGLKKNKRKFYPDSPLASVPTFFDFVGKQPRSAKADRRLVVLNKLLMSNISDIMSSGELCPEVAGKGLHLSKVAMTPTLNQINVYWLANGDKEHDDEMADILAELAPKLRHKLSQLKVIGVVPKIEFIKDSKYLKYMIVENILQKADYGEDHEQTPLANDWKSENTIAKSLSEEMKEKIKEAESSVPVPDEKLPLMQTNVLGLNHKAIMDKVIQSVEKMKAAHRKNAKLSATNDTKENFGSTSNEINFAERKQLLKDYLRSRQVAWRKEHKKMKAFRPEVDIHEKEMESLLMKEFMDDVYDRESNFDMDGREHYYDEYEVEGILEKSKEE